MAGSRRGLTRLTSRKPRRCWESWGDNTGGHTTSLHHPHPTLHRWQPRPVSSALAHPRHAHHTGGRPVCHGVACSSTCPTRSTIPSPKGRPASWRDNGSPVDVKPHGSANVGKPVALKGSILLRGKPTSGSCARVNGVAGVGVVGVATTSTSRKTCAISLHSCTRRRCAWRYSAAVTKALDVYFISSLPVMRQPACKA